MSNKSIITINKKTLLDFARESKENKEVILKVFPDLNNEINYFDLSVFTINKKN